MFAASLSRAGARGAEFAPCEAHRFHFAILVKIRGSHKESRLVATSAAAVRLNLFEQRLEPGN